MVNQAILAGDRPLADVLFGVDTTFLSRALDADLFEPYLPAGPGRTCRRELQLDPAGRVTPIDYGDVCVNLDLDAFGGAGQPPLPSTLDDLMRPGVPGHARGAGPRHLLARASRSCWPRSPRYGDEGATTWRDYWAALRPTTCQVAADWSNAYYGRFSGGANEGDRPMVVSYASSPVAEVVFADPRPAEPPTGVLLDGCFRQVEYAGVLAGTDAPAEARAFIDFLLSPAVQSDIPLTMFVTPALASAEIPADYAAFAADPGAPLSLDPAVIDAGRERWIEEWTDIVLR